MLMIAVVNDEGDAEPDAACEEDSDDVRIHKGHSRGTYQLGGLVDHRRAKRHESDPQCIEDCLGIR